LLDVLRKVELDVALLEIVVVDLYRAFDHQLIQIDDPRGEPFSSPEAVEIQVVTREFNADVVAVLGWVDTEFSCSFAVLSPHV